jgi:type IV pilus assembly protein PilM
MARTVVGVDIGSSAVRAVEVSGFNTARPSISRYHEVALPEGSVRRGEVIEVATVATALKRLWSTAGFRSKDVVLGMGGQRVFARDLSVPRASLEQIRESLPFHVQELLPVPVADVLLDFYPIEEEAGENGPMVKGLLVAGLKDAVNANVEAAMAAGLHAIHVDFVPFALSRALAPVRSSRGRDLIVSLGANSSNVVVVGDGVPTFVRILPNGGDDVTRALAKRLSWAPEQAEAAKRTLGMGGGMMREEDRPVIEIVYEVVGELLASVRSTLTYYLNARPAEPVQRILLSGGASQMIGLPNALAELTRLPVTVADPLQSVAGQARGKSRSESTSGGDFATAYGLALGSHA